MTFPYRCLGKFEGKRCSGRISVKHRMIDSKDGPICKICGGNRWYFDSYRYTKEDKKDLCYADCLVPYIGKQFPHKKRDKRCRYHHEYVFDKAGNKRQEPTTDKDPGF